MQSQYSNNPLSVHPWILVIAGFLMGQTSQAPNALDNFYLFVDNTLVPLYTTLVLAYLSRLFLQTYVLRAPSSSAVPTEIGSETGVDEGADEEQPIDMSGKYKLMTIENFDAFLEVQGVPWPLRRAACKARPVHRITHKGNRLTIRIEGIITTQTTYIINGPPVEINIRGRIFQDRFIYLDKGNGIRGIKKAITENYDVFIDRVLSEDKQTIVLTSRAVFKDDRETVESRQIFRRIQ